MSILKPIIIAFLDDLCEEDPVTAQKLVSMMFGDLHNWILTVTPDQRCGCLIGSTLLAYEPTTTVEDYGYEVVGLLTTKTSGHRWSRLLMQRVDEHMGGSLLRNALLQVGYEVYTVAERLYTGSEEMTWDEAQDTVVTAIKDHIRLRLTPPQVPA